ncbi:MAG TPA: ABC transporter permease [Actinomycetota bacterium]|nr:ABC transporter permease [Actinomycetota bacterium]
MSVSTRRTEGLGGVGMRASWAIHDGLVLTRRNLFRYVRIPTLLVFSTIQPVMFVLLFRYVFGGAITGLPPGIDYVAYLMPGIFVQTAIFGATQTGIGLAEDINAGVIDRFKSLPAARSAVLAGRTTADLFRNLFVVLLMTAVGYLVGFRFRAGLVDAVLGIGLAVLVGFAFSWISAAIGLAIKNLESVQAASFVWIFPLTFASSAFVPTQGMPGWLQVFARNNPVTIWANTLRGFTLGSMYISSIGESTFGLIWKSGIWIGMILAFFVPVSIRIYRRT